MTTRTLNRLPFQDLEPRRFEDLVRQLIYEFKPWRRLEATGRAGGDSGFDARGYEIRNSTVASSEDEIEEEVSIENDDRLWLIQCKREAKIGPALLKKYLAEIVLDASSPLYGIVFVAACDFSKTTRDALVTWCRDNGISEWHIWGRGELEDMIFRPQFDHLLFAYFGISLAIRRRSLATELRRQVAIKRRLKKMLDAEANKLVLIRDIDGTHYPWLPETGKRSRVRVRAMKEITAHGLAIRLVDREAWLSADSEQWDVALAGDGCRLQGINDDWNLPVERELALSETALEFWNTLPETERAWLHVTGFLPYAQIALIDEIGDDCFEGPHIYVTGWDAGYTRVDAYIKTIERPSRTKHGLEHDSPSRSTIFPPETRHQDIDKKRWGF